MLPWERRLGDLRQLLSNCGATYFDPDLFRMNTNQFLQTARTVTFLIAKQRDAIPNFDAWHDANIARAWAGDEVMRWAKDSRNKIEKEGDLDLHGTLRVSLFFSYLEEEDTVLRVGRAELLGAGITKLIRLARQRLPTSIADAAAIKIERRWVAATLTTFELLHALSHIYSRLAECCEALASHLGAPFPDALDADHEIENLLQEARGIRYLKLQSGRSAGQRILRIKRDDSFKAPEMLADAFEELRTSFAAINSHQSALAHFERMAETTFAAYGSHVPMLFVFDRDWKVVYNISSAFADQVEKYIFWRNVAEKVHTLRAHALVWVCESWLRDLKTGAGLPVRKMPILGEVLKVCSVTSSGEFRETTWRIVRDNGAPRLERTTDASFRSKQVPFFFVPAMKAMGVTDPLKASSPHD